MVHATLPTSDAQLDTAVCKKDKRESGDYSDEVTPVPISNTEVKLICADDTWWATARESRTLPVYKTSPIGLVFLFSKDTVIFISRFADEPVISENRFN